MLPELLEKTGIKIRIKIMHAHKNVESVEQEGSGASRSLMWATGSKGRWPMAGELEQDNL